MCCICICLACCLQCLVVTEVKEAMTALSFERWGEASSLYLGTARSQQTWLNNFSEQTFPYCTAFLWAFGCPPSVQCSRSINSIVPSGALTLLHLLQLCGQALGWVRKLWQKASSIHSNPKGPVSTCAARHACGTYGHPESPTFGCDTWPGPSPKWLLQRPRGLRMIQCSRVLKAWAQAHASWVTLRNYVPVVCH